MNDEQLQQKARETEQKIEAVVSKRWGAPTCTKQCGKIIAAALKEAYRCGFEDAGDIAHMSDERQPRGEKWTPDRLINAINALVRMIPNDERLADMVPELDELEAAIADAHKEAVQQTESDRDKAQAELLRLREHIGKSKLEVIEFYESIIAAYKAAQQPKGEQGCTIGEVHEKIQTGLAAARLTPEYAEEGRELESSEILKYHIPRGEKWTEEYVARFFELGVLDDTVKAICDAHNASIAADCRIPKPSKERGANKLGCVQGRVRKGTQHTARSSLA